MINSNFDFYNVDVLFDITEHFFVSCFLFLMLVPISGLLIVAYASIPYLCQSVLLGYHYLYLLRYKIMLFYISLIVKPLGFLIFSIIINFVIRTVLFNQILLLEEKPVLKDSIYVNNETGDVHIEVLSKSGQVYTFVKVEDPNPNENELSTTEKVAPYSFKPDPIKYEHHHTPRDNHNTGNFFTNWLSDWWQRRWVSWWEQRTVSSKLCSAELNAEAPLPVFAHQLSLHFGMIIQDNPTEIEDIMKHLTFVETSLPQDFFSKTEAEYVDSNTKINLLLTELGKRLYLDGSIKNQLIIFHLQTAIQIVDAAHVEKENIQDKPERYALLYQQTFNKFFTTAEG